jgi:hypothetical protein
VLWQGALLSLRNSVRGAEANPGHAGTLLDILDITEMHRHEDNLRMVLAPMLHRDRYARKIAIGLRICY